MQSVSQVRRKSVRHPAEAAAPNIPHIAVQNIDPQIETVSISAFVCDSGELAEPAQETVESVIATRRELLVAALGEQAEHTVPVDIRFPVEPLAGQCEPFAVIS